MDKAADEVLAGYRAPSQRVRDKVIPALDGHCRAFIALSPFATLATAGPDGWPDVSPRGGDPGFVHVLDEHRLALPDRQGNNRLDSLRKVVAHPRAALVFFVRGVLRARRRRDAAGLRDDVHGGPRRARYRRPRVGPAAAVRAGAA